MRRFLPSLSALHAFEAAARHLSFTRAAEDLGMTQSGVSRQIHNLEHYLGCRLFERSGPRLLLTELGASYFREVSRMLDHLQEASIDVVRGRKASTSLLIGMHPTLASNWLAPRLHSFISTHPAIPIDITQAEPRTEFDNSKLDFAILRGISPWPNARAYELFPEELAVIAAPSLVASGEKLTPDDFGKFTMLQNSSRPSLWLHWLRMAGLSYHGPIQGPRFSTSAMLISAAKNGLGLAIVPKRYIETELANGDLHLPFGDAVRSGESYFAVYPERKSHMQSINVFRDWILRETRHYRCDTP